MPVVAQEHIGSLDADLALALVHPVLHVRDVLKLDVVAGERGANVVRAGVTLESWFRYSSISYSKGYL